MSFLDKLFSRVKKGGSVLGVDIGSSSLKVVQLRKQQGRAILETYGELALGPYANKEVGQATELTADVVATTLTDLIREAKVTTKEAGISIPFSRSLLTMVKLPRRNNKQEQDTVIELEARKYIPVPVAEVQLDWFIIPDQDPGKARTDSIDVLLVAVHNDELRQLEAIASGASLAAHFYELEIFSTIRAVIDEPVKPVMVIDIGAATTKVYVVEHGVVALSHIITRGGQDATRAIATASSLSLARAEELKKQGGLGDGSELKSSIEFVFGQIFSEAKRVFLQYETGHSKPISGIVLTGGGGVTKELGPYAQSLFAVPVSVADPFAKTEAPAFMRPVLAAIGPEFAVAVGLALRLLEENR